MKHPLITPTLALSALALGLLAPSVAHSAAITYGTAGSSYTQNFDSFGTGTGAWTNGTTLTGWHWTNANGNLSANYNARNGSVSAQSMLLSLGSTDSTDRAFGAQNSNEIQTLYYGAQILNTTGGALDSFALSYIGEQWRVISGEAQDKLTFQYQIFTAGAANPLLASTGWTSVSALDFNAPQTTTGGSTSLDGNLAANRVSISSTVTGLSWGDGQELWLRWTDNNPANNNASSRRAMIGIDDVSFSATSAIPEPGTYALFLGALALGFTAHRRRR